MSVARLGFLVVSAAMLGCLAAPAAAASPTTQATADGSSVESLLIRHGPITDAPQSNEPLDPERSGNFELPRVAGALAIVIGLIFVLRWGGQRIFTSPVSPKSTRAVQVLSRSILAPRQHVLLVQVGKRVIVVGDSGGQMSSLCQITDPDEIATLVGQIQEEKSTAVVGAFKSIFRRQKPDVEEELAAESSISAGEAEDERAGPVEPIEDTTLSGTRSELSGLMDKVRLLSQQFRNG